MAIDIITRNEIKMIVLWPSSCFEIKLPIGFITRLSVETSLVNCFLQLIFVVNDHNIIKYSIGILINLF